MNTIQEILLQRGCPAHQEDDIALKIERLSEQLRPAMQQWLDTESPPTVEVDGITTDSLMARFAGMHYPAAVLLLDWLIKDPKTARKAIAKGLR